jgi:hypothetical protein
MVCPAGLCGVNCCRLSSNIGLAGVVGLVLLASENMCESSASCLVADDDDATTVDGEGGALDDGADALDETEDALDDALVDVEALDDALVDVEALDDALVDVEALDDAIVVDGALVDADPLGTFDGAGGEGRGTASGGTGSSQNSDV